MSMYGDCHLECSSVPNLFPSSGTCIVLLNDTLVAIQLSDSIRPLKVDSVSLCRECYFKRLSTDKSNIVMVWVLITCDWSNSTALMFFGRLVLEKYQQKEDDAARLIILIEQVNSDNHCHITIVSSWRRYIKATTGSPSMAVIWNTEWQSHHRIPSQLCRLRYWTF